MKYAQIFALGTIRLALLAALLVACSGCATIQGLWDKYVKPEIEKPEQPEQPARTARTARTAAER